MSRSHSAREIAAFSRSLLDRPLVSPRALTVATATDEGNIAGAFGYDETRLPVRGSGGPSLTIGIESVYVAFNLESAARVDADPSRTINRAVRPLLRALKKCGLASAMYGDRDFVAQKGAPIAWVGFQHDAGTNRVAFEALVATRTPFEAGGRASFRGRVPVSLRDAGCLLTGDEIASRIVDAYLHDDLASTTEVPLEGGTLLEEARRPIALSDDAIGRVGVIQLPNGQRAIAGDFQGSRDFVAAANAAISSAKNGDDACSAIDVAANSERVVMFGLASLDAMKDAVARAFAI